ncbi:MAG: hypothetical protein JWN46_833 [Acidimicrobiales bacterium]|nr:hypothetical protein [Acidimicrobiales bacterium]
MVDEVDAGRSGPAAADVSPAPMVSVASGPRASLGRAARSWGPTLAALTPLTILLVRNLLVASRRIQPASDIAVLEIATRSLTGGTQLLGPYSRFVWHHPGPLVFGWYAPFWLSVGRRPGGMALAALTGTLLSVALVVRTLDRILGRPAGWLVAAVTTTWCAAIGFQSLQSPWNPLVIIAPAAALGVVAVALGTGRRWALPVVALLGSFVVQTHVGAGPVAVALVVVALAVGVRRRPAGGGSWWPAAAVTLVVVAAAWALPVLEEVRHGSNGNLHKLQRFFRPGGTHARPGLSMVLHRITVSLSLSPYRRTDAPGVAHWVIAIVVIAGTVALAIVGLRRRDRARAALGLCTLGALAASFLAALAARGYLDLYLVTSTVGVALLAWLCTATLVLDLVVGWRPGATGDAARGRPRLVWASRAAVVFAVLAAGFVSVRGATVRPWTTPPAHPNDTYRLMTANTDSAVVARLANVASSTTSGRGAVRVSFPQEAWPIGVGIVDELQRAGRRVTVDRAWIFMVGDHLAPTGREAVVLVVAPIGRAVDRHRYRLIARTAAYGLYQAR